MNTEFVERCKKLVSGESFERETLSFDELFNLKYPEECKQDPFQMFLWNKFFIDAKTTIPIKINEEIHPANTEVRVWMVSRFGDVGITNNMLKSGYDTRVPIEQLYNFKITKK